VSRAVRAPVLLLALVLALPAAAQTNLSARLKAFGARAFLPGDDLVRRLDDTPSDRASLDARLMGTWRGEGVELELAWEGSVLHDVSGGAAAVIGDARDDRLLDLEGTLARGTDTRLVHRLDRARLGIDLGPWTLDVGRQARSAGGGLVFQPMDFLNPFSPTEIDRDYKRGDDLIVLSRGFDDGSEASLLVAGRRGDDAGLSTAASSAVVRWRGLHGALGLEVMGGAHLDDPLLAASFSGPAGTAAWRADVVAQRTDDGWHVSAVANVDWTTVVAGRNVYLFAEAYRNGFGLDAPSLAALAREPALRRRVARGELFTLGEHHLALGTTVEWHPLVRQSVLLLAEAQDGSALAQSTLDWDPDDAQTVQVSVVAPLGGRGQEYGRLVAGVAPDGDPLTVGGGPRLLLRWSRWF
jgi:hypothetical protein